MTTKSSKTSFTLHVDPVKVDRDFKTIEKSHGYHTFNPMVTSLEDLGISEEKISDTIFTTIGQAKFVTHYPEYMINKSYPKTTSIPCFYCTESFTTHPIGIPLRYISSYSKYPFKDRDEMVTLNRTLRTTKDMEDAQKNREEIIYRDYFQTEGNFCSFPCLQSYLRYHPEDAHNEIYPLIKQYFTSLYGKDVVYQREFAPDIRLLKKFGGHLTISEFRSSEGRKYSRSVNFMLPKFNEQEKPNRYVPCSRMFQYLDSK